GNYSCRRLQSPLECLIFRTIGLEGAGKPPWPQSSLAGSPKHPSSLPGRIGQRATYRARGAEGASETYDKVAVGQHPVVTIVFPMPRPLAVRDCAKLPRSVPL